VDSTQAGSLCYTNSPKYGAMSEKHPLGGPPTKGHHADGLYHRLPACVMPVERCFRTTAMLAGAAVDPLFSELPIHHMNGIRRYLTVF
jgi:hypothetical protein